MKKIMYAVYSGRQMFPREVYDRAKDAKEVVFRLKAMGITYVHFRRVELDFKEFGAFDVYTHEYKRLNI